MVEHACGHVFECTHRRPSAQLHARRHRPSTAVPAIPASSLAPVKGSPAATLRPRTRLFTSFLCGAMSTPSFSPTCCRSDFSVTSWGRRQGRSAGLSPSLAHNPDPRLKNQGPPPPSPQSQWQPGCTSARPEEGRVHRTPAIQFWWRGDEHARPRAATPKPPKPHLHVCSDQQLVQRPFNSVVRRLGLGARRGSIARGELFQVEQPKVDDALPVQEPKGVPQPLLGEARRQSRRCSPWRVAARVSGGKPVDIMPAPPHPECHAWGPRAGRHGSDHPPGQPAATGTRHPAHPRSRFRRAFCTHPRAIAPVCGS